MSSKTPEKKAFFLTSGSPTPIHGARRIRDAQIITLLAKYAAVEIICITDPKNETQIKTQCAQIFGDRVQVFCYPKNSSNKVSDAIEWFKPHFAQGYCDQIENHLATHAKKGDLVWISRLRMAVYLKQAQNLGCKTVLDEHQIESDLLFDNAFSSPKYWLQGIAALQCARYEKQLCTKAEFVVTPTPIDATRMQKLSPKSSIRIIPHGITTHTKYTAQTQHNSPQILFFSDLDYQPDLHGLYWFLNEVFPRLKAAHQGLQKFDLWVVGSSENLINNALGNLPFDAKLSISHIDDLSKGLSQNAVAVFPLRYGRGNRTHILEAMSNGIPVVTTGKAADGLVLRPGDEVLLAEDADLFTSHILRILRDASYKDTIKQNALRAIETRFNPNSAHTAFEELLVRLSLITKT